MKISKFFELASFCIFAINILPGLCQLQCYNDTTSQIMNCTGSANITVCLTMIQFQNDTAIQKTRTCGMSTDTICNSTGCDTSNNVTTTCRNCCSTSLCNKMTVIKDFNPSQPTTPNPPVSDAAKPVAGLLIWLVCAPFILKNFMS